MNGGVTGCVDACDDGTLLGWAARPGVPNPVVVEIVHDGVRVGEAVAGIYREDLKLAGHGSGHHGFAFRVPDLVRASRDYVLDVRERDTGVALTNSPFSVHEDPEHPFARGGAQLRRFVAAQYCAGEGLEIGALHRPMPLPVGVRVRYVDAFDTETLRRLWTPEVDGQLLVPVDVVTDATTLRGVDDASADFVIASHIVEHVEDPIRCLINLLRVVRANGIVLIVLPDRRHTFDARRPATSVEHVMRDYAGDPARSRRAHYQEWVSLVENLDGERAAARVAALQSTAYPIHFHVWTPMEFTRLLAELDVISPFRFELDFVKAAAPEAFWVLRRIE